ncbi:recombinase family protein [Oribacterium sp. HCP3S3_B9]|jgi:site-specific DNA recombinase|uniref:recombinase family protein n=1 Tax=Oribacterium sp. HCP3S3_B9 TaxID=3438946 RepID=UPI003F8C5881
MPLAQNITVIPAIRKVGTQKPETKVQKTRVAAYCRVSTEYEEQESSYDVQVEHYTTYIKSKPEWEFVEVYADDGISGTNTKKRDEFNRMIDDCKAGKIDMILTKSISRFSRNTVDCLKYTRELKALNIAVFFEKENINTLDAKGEVLMTIMAALAQQESESLSANVRLGIQFRNQQGKVQVNHNRFLGYTKDENGKLVIVPEQAEIVKRIYAEYMDGASFLQIKRGLEADGILNGAGNKKWEVSNIRQILTNEKYIGDALLQKTYTVSVLEKKRVKNDGQVPKYYVEGSHEAIIDRDVFLRVQAEIDRRANIIKGGKKRVYSSKYALSSVIICGHCGDIFRRIKWNNHGCKSTVWRCVSRVNKKKSGIHCPARTVHEEVIQAAVVTAINDAWSRKDEILPQLKENIRAVLQEDTDAKIAEIDTAVKEKQEELLKVGKDENKIAEIGEAIMKLREERQQVMTDAAMHKDVTDRIEDLSNFLDEQTGAITEYSDALVRRLIEKITVYDEALVVKFKSGLEITVDA